MRKHCYRSLKSFFFFYKDEEDRNMLNGSHSSAPTQSGQ